MHRYSTTKQQKRLLETSNTSFACLFLFHHTISQGSYYDDFFSNQFWLKAARSQEFSHLFSHIFFPTPSFFQLFETIVSYIKLEMLNCSLTYCFGDESWVLKDKGTSWYYGVWMVIGPFEFIVEGEASSKPKVKVVADAMLVVKPVLLLLLCWKKWASALHYEEEGLSNGGQRARAPQLSLHAHDFWALRTSRSVSRFLTKLW